MACQESSPDPTPSFATPIARANGTRSITIAYSQLDGRDFHPLAHWLPGRTPDPHHSSAKVIPLAMSGWDRRFRVANPVPWEHFNAPADNYYEPGTPDQIAQHIAHAVARCRMHPDVADTQAVILRTERTRRG